MNLHDARILVTGGGGFLGSHLLETLTRRLSVRAQHPYAPHRVLQTDARRPTVVAPRSSYCDLRDLNQTSLLFSRETPDVVFHLAARVGGIGANQKHPGTYFRDNMLMGVNVLEAARIYRVAKVVMVGTVCSYPAETPVPFHEFSLWNGFPEATNAPYGVAKRALLTMAQAYRHEFGLNTAFVLLANLYGPRDNFDLETSHVIPAMVRKFVEAHEAGDSEVRLWGDGSPTRDFLHARDAAEGLCSAAETYDDASPVNIGSGIETDMASLAEKIGTIVGYHGKISWDGTRPNGQARRVLNIHRAERELNFRVTTNFDEGLTETVRWYQAWHERLDSEA